MDKIINILLLVIIFVFDPLAISLVVAANFAFDQANRKNLYGETVSEKDIFDELDDDEDDWPRASQNHLDEWDVDDVEVNDPEIVEPEEDWKVVDDEKEVTPTPKKILQKGPSNHRVLYSDGSTRRVNKDDNTIRYL